ncbi:MAG: TRAP transporter small permease [Spirochaetes bacterium]|nr:TRAP transporter small permease [Spirochaetota bacterium]
MGLERIYRIVDRVRAVLIVLIMGFIIGIGAVQIVLRYSPLTKPFDWVDEIMRYLNIWVVFLAASIGVKESTHLSMDYFLKKYFSTRTVGWIKRATHVCIILTMLLLIYHGSLRVWANRYTFIQSMHLSISFFYLAIPIGSALILFEYILVLLHGGDHPYKG